MNDNSFVAILLCIVLAGVLLYLIKNGTEAFGFPFNSLRSTPQPPNMQSLYHQPYCTDVQGNPVPCAEPCQKVSPTCQYSFPVPVLSNDIGAYSPSVWCPGPPLC